MSIHDNISKNVIIRTNMKNIALFYQQREAV